MTNWQEKMGKNPKNQQNPHEDVENQNRAKYAENDAENEGMGVQNQQNDENSSQNQENQPQNQTLEQKLAAEQQKSAELNNKLLRALAEIENVRRRAKEDLEKANNYAISGFVSELVVVAENFFLACDNMPQKEMEESNEVKNFAIGVDMTKKELMKILEKNNVKRIFPLGENFDPNIHEAMSQVESEEEEGKIIQVIQAGYTIGSRIVRPALVSVSKGK